jgi:hypothetical protein
MSSCWSSGLPMVLLASNNSLMILRSYDLFLIYLMLARVLHYINLNLKNILLTDLRHECFKIMAFNPSKH